MPETRQKLKMDEASEFYSGVAPEKNPVVYSVILEGVKSEMETPESFAIKFGLISSTSVTKIRYIIDKAPYTVWSGSSMTKAKGLLSLIVEAGGRGRISENAPEAGRKNSKTSVASDKEPGTTCSKCGFPMKKGESFCEFCLTPVTGISEKPHHRVVKGKKPSIPPARLLLYLLFVFASIVISIVIK